MSNVTMMTPSTQQPPAIQGNTGTPSPRLAAEDLPAQEGDPSSANPGNTYEARAGGEFLGSTQGFHAVHPKLLTSNSAATKA
mmetsp:Transcript_69500/g.203356  ORF Transcript_69500/g.203356 Transcript_69500/m.203356 type:complete len:82 (+) Transcript_69500:161-406(+)